MIIRCLSFRCTRILKWKELIRWLKWRLRGHSINDIVLLCYGKFNFIWLPPYVSLFFIYHSCNGVKYMSVYIIPLSLHVCNSHISIVLTQLTQSIWMKNHNVKEGGGGGKDKFSITVFITELSETISKFVCMHMHISFCAGDVLEKIFWGTNSQEVYPGEQNELNEMKRVKWNETS